VIWLLAGATLPSFLVALLAGFMVRSRAGSWRLVDRPGERKVHAAVTPLGGGIAIWLGVLLPLAIGHLLLVLMYRSDTPAVHLPAIVTDNADGLLAQAGRLWMLLAAGTVLMGLGLMDDRRGLDWRLRIAVQTGIAVLVVASGWRLTLFIEWPLATSFLSVLWIVVLVNAFNFLDNMDGLSAGVAAIAASILAAVLLSAPELDGGGPQWFVAGFLLVLVGALVGFLWHNRPPARLFMGDAGSYFIGFYIAVATIMATFSGGGQPRHAILAPLCVLAVPLYDAASVVVIRLRQGRSPFQGDTSHFSHRLVELGLSKTQAVLTIYLATATTGLGALLLYQVNGSGAALILVLVACVLALVAILEGTSPRRS